MAPQETNGERLLATGERQPSSTPQPVADPQHAAQPSACLPRSTSPRSTTSSTASRSTASTHRPRASYVESSLPEASALLPSSTPRQGRSLETATTHGLCFPHRRPSRRRCQPLRGQRVKPRNRQSTRAAACCNSLAQRSRESVAAPPTPRACRRCPSRGVPLPATPAQCTCSVAWLRGSLEVSKVKTIKQHTVFFV